MPGSPAPQKGMKTVKPAGLTIAAISGFGPDRGAIPARTTDREPHERHRRPRSVARPRSRTTLPPEASRGPLGGARREPRAVCRASASSCLRHDPRGGGVRRGGRVAAIRNAWAFDDFYTAFLEQGLDKGPDGRYSRETLADLAKTNTEGLSDADYFTFVKANGRSVKFGAPKDYWLEDTGKHLVLHFTLPLADPVKPSKAFVMRIYDPTYFVAFDPVQDAEAVKLEGQQPGCSLLVRKPPQNDALKQTLAQIDITQQPSLEDAGAAFADSILVACP